MLSGKRGLEKLFFFIEDFVKRSLVHCDSTYKLSNLLCSRTRDICLVNKNRKGHTNMYSFITLFKVEYHIELYSFVICTDHNKYIWMFQNTNQLLGMQGFDVSANRIICSKILTSLIKFQI